MATEKIASFGHSGFLTSHEDMRIIYIHNIFQRISTEIEDLLVILKRQLEIDVIQIAHDKTVYIRYLNVNWPKLPSCLNDLLEDTKIKKGGRMYIISEDEQVGSWDSDDLTQDKTNYMAIDA
ncbi:hypothetical protein K501DRAFT_265769 [Backusella circina FSU 941]|nr:hypothetical protein K501DRAFT_265769 [Backusella circina FSU 941]